MVGVLLDLSGWYMHQMTVHLGLAMASYPFILRFGTIFVLFYACSMCCADGGHLRFMVSYAVLESLFSVAEVLL